MNFGKTGGWPIPWLLEKLIINGVTGYDYIDLVEEKQAHCLSKFSSGAMFKNLKPGLKI